MGTETIWLHTGRPLDVRLADNRPNGDFAWLDQSAWRETKHAIMTAGPGPLDLRVQALPGGTWEFRRAIVRLTA